MWIKTQKYVLVNLDKVSQVFVWGGKECYVAAIVAGKDGEAFHEEEKLFTGSKEECDKELAHLWKAIQQGESWHYMGSGTPLAED